MHSSRSEVPDLLEPVVGWRVWETDKDSLLGYVYLRFRWPVGVVEASCIYGTGHPAPSPHCKCGIYSVSDYSLLRLSVPPIIHDVRIAIGRVALWGRLEKHQNGWRGEKARPLSLCIVNGFAATWAPMESKRERVLLNKYGVPREEIPC